MEATIYEEHGRIYEENNTPDGYQYQDFFFNISRNSSQIYDK